MAKKEILFKLTRKDFVIKPFKAPGKGGQKKNKTMSACRIQHLPSGSMATCTDSRKYPRNEAAAFRRLIETKEFKKWHSLECSRKLGHLDAAEQAAEEAMLPKNLMVEVKDENGRWVEE